MELRLDGASSYVILKGMPPSPSPSASLPSMVLGIDTCGPSGSVALARLAGTSIEILGEVPLEGRTYSATLVAAVSDLLSRHQTSLPKLRCLVVVNGPGSFTGVRVGLSAAKGLAEGAGIPLIAISRLEVLAHKAGLGSAALDAHRHEVFLRAEGRELLAGGEDLRSFDPSPEEIAICDDPAAALLAHVLPDTQQIRTDPPTAADAIRLAVPRILAADFADLSILDGHYLRRSDAEIFGDPAPQPKTA